MTDRRFPLVMACLLALAAMAMPLQAAWSETVRFSNIRFDTGGDWNVEQQFPEMILRPANEMLASSARIVITPAAPFPGTLEEARDAAWTDALGGRDTRGDAAASEERGIPGDGIERGIGAFIEPVGGAYVSAIKSGDFATTITFSAETDSAYQLGTMMLARLLMTLEIVADEPPTVTVSGVGGGSGSSVSFDWDGPDRLDYGIYDHGCMNYGYEFRSLVNANSSLVGSVAPQTVGWQPALDAVRARLADPMMKAGYETANKLAAAEKSDPYTLGAATSLVVGEPGAALAHLFAGVEKSPDDPGLLFNFAAVLNVNDMPNEALSAIARLRALDRLPNLPMGVDAQAALDYLTGYAEMLRGDLAAAKANFQSTIGREPFLNEAAHGLALIQAHEGGAAQGKQTYLGGMWRFKPKYLVTCGGQDDEEVRPPVDDMFDTSMGVEGKLVKFWHPDKASDLGPFFEMAGALGTAANDRAEPLKQRMIAMGSNPRFAGGTGDPYDAWADKLSQIIWDLDVLEPYVLQKQDALERAIENVQRVGGQNVAFVIQRIVELAMTPGNHCPTYRSLITNGIRGVLPHAERVEAEFREVARVWYKIATGLNSNIGDPEWFEYNDVSLRATLESMNAGMLAMFITYYSFPADLVRECPEEFVEIALAQEETPQGDECKEMFGNLKVKQSVGMPAGMPGPKFTAEISCDSIKAEAEFDLLGANAHGFGTALGVHGSAEFKRGGDFMLFAGPRVDVGAPGLEGGVKTGAFLTGNADGIENLGGRIEIEGKGGLEGGKVGLKDEMDFGLLSPPKAPPRGPTMQAYRPRIGP